MNVCYYLKFQIPIMHRPFFRKTSQNGEYIKTHCNGLYDPFQSACRK